MSEQRNPTVKCQACGEILDEPTSTPVDERSPCPNCGSKARHFEVVISGTIEVHEKLGLKARHGATGKPFLESVSGDDLHRKSGKWMTLERVIDRENDRYKEVVTDPVTGEIIHLCEEPLSQHQGHGSDKKKKDGANSGDSEQFNGREGKLATS
jgi:DNA-directed RNA polymerase subunit RPC12/RpoP